MRLSKDKLTDKYKFQLITQDKDGIIEKYFNNEGLCEEINQTELGQHYLLTEAYISNFNANINFEEKAFFSFYCYDELNFLMELSFVLNDEENENAYKFYKITYLPDFFTDAGLASQDKLPFSVTAVQNGVYDLDTITANALKLVFENGDGDIHMILQRQESLLLLLRRSIEAYTVAQQSDQMPACSFLSSNAEREKVMQASKLIKENIDSPLTIKSLSRMVGMNECYLKKGFKAMYGKTIHDYYQNERVEQAKLLLYHQKLSVNQVSDKLGFSSPSHFSSVFKKITGMKPCDLLNM